MRTIRKTILMTLVMALVSAGMATSGRAQYGTSDSATRDLVRRIQTRTDSLQRAVQTAADRNNYRVDDIDRLILDFESAVNQLDRRLTTRRATSSDAQVVLDRAVSGRQFARISSSSQITTTWMLDGVVGSLAVEVTPTSTISRCASWWTG